MTELKEEASADPVSFELKDAADFSAAQDVTTALTVIAALDAGPATTEEIAAIEKVLGSFPHDLITVPLAERMRRLGGFALEFKGVMVAIRFDGTSATTTCTATYGDGRAADTGQMAITAFPNFLTPIGVSDRGKVAFTVTIKALMPKGKAPFGWVIPKTGDWIETLAHELLLHGEADVDSVIVYRAGSRWPYQLQSTQHWMFLQRCLPRYLLWLRRLSTGPYQAFTPDFLASLRKWAKGQETPPPSVANAIGGTPDISHLRELSALLRLAPPSEDSDNAKLIAAARDILTATAAKTPLWWLPS